MMRTILSLAAGALLLGCEANPTPTELAPDRPSTVISDGAHSGGNAHFYFLPPLVPNPAHTGMFDGSLSPIVEICAIGNDGCEGLIATYSTTTGPGSETVRLDATEEHYIVNWHTDQFAVESGRTYRLRILILKTLIGYADVALLENGSEARNLDTGEIVGLVDGRTLPIKFRIEEGAVYVVQPPQPGEAPVVIATSDGTVSLSIPEGALSEPVAITIEPVTLASGDPADAYLVGGTVYEFGPDGATFGSPVTVTLSYDPGGIPAHRKTESLRLVTRLSGDWQVIAGSRVDEVGLTVSAELAHFSTYALESMSLITMAGEEGSYSNCGLFAAYEDGTGFRKLVPKHDVFSHAWSPTGAEIAYLHGEVWITDGETERSVGSVSNLNSHSRPSWSPDGTKIIVQGWQNFYLFDASGLSGPIQVTNADGWWDFDGSWSPDGTRIVFARDQSATGGYGDLYEINPDGTGEKQITATPRYEWGPVYSADGSKIAFAALDTETWLWSVEVLELLTGTTAVVYSGYDQWDLRPKWTPDGRILFHALVEGVHGFWIVNADGTNPLPVYDPVQFQEDVRGLCGEAIQAGRFADWQP